MDDQRITVLESRFNCILPTLATKSEIAKLHADMLSELRVRDIAQRPCVADPSEDLARTFRNFKILLSILMAFILILTLWTNVAVYVEGERIIAGRQAVAAAVQTGALPPAPILNSGNERQ